MNFFKMVFLVFSVFAGENQCRDILSDIHWADVPLIAYQEIPFQPSEVRRHGITLPLDNQQVLSDFKETLFLRDGIYIFIFDRRGTLLIDHQLPIISMLPSLISDSAFYGTHRGLYNKRIFEFGSCEVVFAGELLVTNGRMEWISDNSAFYYNLPNIKRIPRETERDFRFRSNNVRQRIIEASHSKLIGVHRLFWSWGWAGAHTRIKQTEKSTEDFDENYRHVAYISGRNRARFERECRAEAFCWQTYEGIQTLLKRFDGAGGFSVFNQHRQELYRHDAVKTHVLVQFLSMVRDQGLMDLLYKQINIENKKIPPTIEGFLQALEWYLLELEFL